MHRMMAYWAARFIGLLLVTIGLVGCGNFIEIVPDTPPSPTPTVPPTATPTPVANSGPTHISAPVINLDAPVVAMGWRATEQAGQLVSTWNMPDNEAAWHQNSGLPGQGSNVVISGHNASTGGRVFAELDELQVGDEITLTTSPGELMIYQVVEKNIIRTFANASRAEAYLQSVMDPTPQERLTLITCWPRWSNTHRLIVVAEPKPRSATSSDQPLH